MPRVSVMNSVRKPMRARAGTRYSMRTQPVPWFTMSCSRPLRVASSWVTVPRCSAGTCTDMRSTGSHSLPSISLVTTWGLPTTISKPSRRMVSTRTASCSSPRPRTSQVSGRSVVSTRSDTLPTSSVSRRLLIWRAVSLVPSGAGQGAGVDPDGDRQAGLVDGHDRQGAGVVGVGQGLADGDVGQAGHGDDLARAHVVGRHPVEALGDRQVGDLDPLDGAVGLAPGHGLVLGDAPVADAAQGQAAEVGRAVEVGDHRLEGVALLVGRAPGCARGAARRGA